MSVYHAILAAKLGTAEAVFAFEDSNVLLTNHAQGVLKIIS